VKLNTGLLYWSQNGQQSFARILAIFTIFDDFHGTLAEIHLPLDAGLLL